jgi:hypothetical protein
MESNHESVSERESGTALKELSDVGTNIESVMPHSPGLQSRSGNLEFLGGLPLGAALGAQLSVLCKELRAVESIPAWLALRVALSLVLDDGSHSDLLL